MQRYNKPETFKNMMKNLKDEIIRDQVEGKVTVDPEREVHPILERDGVFYEKQRPKKRIINKIHIE